MRTGPRRERLWFRRQIPLGPARVTAGWVLALAGPPLLTVVLGGGSGGTAGGIKVTTFAVLAYVIWSELRGDPDVTTFDRRITTTAQRQALAVALISVAAVVVSTIIIALGSELELDRVLFEVVSAFATVGMSTGLTAELAAPHQLLLVVLMFVGRLGPVTLGTALALRERQRLFRHPQGAPIVG